MKMKILFQHPTRWIGLFFLALLVLGLCTAGDYGVYCDQLSEQVILRENMKEYAWQFWGSDSQAVRYYDSLEIQRISESIEIDHGQCAYYPLVPALKLIQTHPALLSWLWHGYTWLWFLLGTLALYGLFRELGNNRPLAFAGMLLYLLSPRFFAEGHYNNKDMILLTLALCCCWLGIRFLKSPTLLRGALFSLAGGMAANTKIVGMAIWGIISLCAVCKATKERKWNKGLWGVAAATLAVFAVTYALLTPAMWKDPLAYFQYLLQNASGFTRWPGVVVFRGMVFDHAVNPLPRYYLPYMMLVTLPLYFFPLCAIGQLSALRRALRQKGELLSDANSLMLLCATVLWIVFLGYVGLARPLVYNGWRHFYFLFAGLVILAGQGLSSLWAFAKKRGKPWRYALLCLCCLCFGASALGIALNHPYQYAYYNSIARENAQEEMELDYWDVSTVNAMKTLLSYRGDQALPLTVSALDAMSWFGLDTGYTGLTLEEQSQIILEEENPEAPYLFVNTTYGLIYGVEIPQGYHPLFTLEGYGNPLCTVYEKDAA